MIWKKILLIGDSHTQLGYSIDNKSGWVSMLSSHLQRKCDVVNRGLSGCNSESLFKYLPDILEEFNSGSIIALVLMIGTNDSSDYFHCPLESYYENLQKICSYIANIWNLDRNRILIITPPMIHDKMWLKEQKNWTEYFGYSNESVAKYSNECLRFCIENDIQYLDFFQAILTEYRTNEDLERLFSDGLHLSACGNSLLFERLKVLLEENISGFKDLKDNYPSWESFKKSS